MMKGNKEMKRFLLFAFDHYYPVGGWHDLVGAYDTIEEAREARTIEKAQRFNFLQIVDVFNLSIVETNYPYLEEDFGP